MVLYSGRIIIKANKESKLIDVGAVRCKIPDCKWIHFQVQFVNCFWFCKNTNDFSQSNFFNWWLNSKLNVVFQTSPKVWERALWRYLLTIPNELIVLKKHNLDHRFSSMSRIPHLHYYAVEEKDLRNIWDNSQHCKQGQSHVSIAVATIKEECAKAATVAGCDGKLRQGHGCQFLASLSYTVIPRPV